MLFMYTMTWIHIFYDEHSLCIKIHFTFSLGINVEIVRLIIMTKNISLITEHIVHQYVMRPIGIRIHYTKKDINKKRIS